MPFTLSHPAAVLPFARPAFRWLPFSALAIGSMSPDFPYFFLSHSDFNGFGHRFLGLFIFDVPFGLFVYFVFHLLLKLPLLALLSVDHQARLVPRAQGWKFPQSAKEWAGIIAALFIGALTHLCWDGFTHYNGWAVTRWQPLATPVFQLPPVLSKRGEFVRVFKFLQYGSTIGGMLLLLRAERRWRQTLPSEGDRLEPTISVVAKIKLLAMMAGVGGSLGAFCVWYKSKYPGEITTLNSIIHDMVVGGMLGAFLVLAGWCINWLHLHKSAIRKPDTAKP